MPNCPLPNLSEREILLLPPWGKACPVSAGAGKGVSGWSVKNCNVRVLCTFLFFTLLQCPMVSQQLNYKEVFGDDWLKALSYEKENRNWMEPVLDSYHLSYPLAIAVIFPEFVRYSALRDKMEITLLKALYINLGNEYADFSIGHFQMKPSFAELILDNLSFAKSDLAGLKLKVKSDFTDIKDFRKSIVRDLEEPRVQMNYLIAFLKICEKKYGLKRKDDTQKLKFLAAAYNFGIDKNPDQIYNMIDKKFFNTKLYKTENYSYADVSQFWFNEFNSDR
jgi:hypothetical protein